MQASDNTSVLIVGAGLAGGLMACYLARAGYRVQVWERRPDPRVHGFAGGRSINLALSTRGITGLEEIGLARTVLDGAVRMPGRMIHDPRGGTTFQPYSSDPDDAINSVSRGGLNITLLDAAEASESVTLRFAQRCIEVDLDAPAATFVDESSGESTRIEADFIIGADGAFSAVRDAMMRRVVNFDYSQSFLAHGYKELEVPPADDGGFRMDPHALHIWPRGGSMMIALPNRDGSFTCTLFWPYEGGPGAHSFEAVRSGGDVEPFFREHYPDAVPLMPTLREDFERNPVGSLVTIRCGPWFHEDKALILGDAAHAIVPFYGQGMNAAFEDCRILDACLREHGGDRSAAFHAFYTHRKPDADAIADLAIDNFIEMRDKTASPVFRAKKRFEQTLHRVVPGLFVPLYNMVSFSNVPYADARRRAKRQWRVVKAAGAIAGLLGAAIGLLVLSAVRS